ncbi:unnamed protein product [Rhizophagus irregularis]|nr:unnamed protein product [Rhizophagus irregularis]
MHYNYIKTLKLQYLRAEKDLGDVQGISSSYKLQRFTQGIFYLRNRTYRWHITKRWSSQKEKVREEKRKLGMTKL